MSDEIIKDEALQALQGLLDDVVHRVQAKFDARGFPSTIHKIDYVAQIAVLEFSDENSQPDAVTSDAIGVELRRQWPQMPDLQATLFRLANRNSKLILNISTAFDVNLSKDTEFEDEDYMAQVMQQAGPKQSAIPIIKYDLTGKNVVKEQATLEVTRDALG
jgi:hypothetical protein